VILDEDFSVTFNARGWGVFTDGFSGGGAPYTQNGTTRLMASGDQSNTHAYVDIAQIGGGTVNAFFDVTDTFSPFVLPGSFVNLDSVRVFDTFSAGFRAGPGSFSVDNLVVNTAAVPEPASLLLLGSGLVAAGLRRRAKAKTRN
jgi:hypothetical protein